MARISENAVQMPASAIRKLVPYADAAKKQGVKVYHLNLGQPDIKSPSCALDAIRSYSQENVSQDDMNFVEKLSGEMRYLFNISYEGKIYAMKFSLTDHLYYFTDEGVDEQYKDCYATTRADHSLNTMLITTMLRRRMAGIKMCYGSGQMRFNSIISKNVFMDIYPLL